MGISLYLNESVLADLVGIGVAHVYYFLTDVYPRLPLSSGVNILSTPVFLYVVSDNVSTYLTCLFILLPFQL